MRQKRTNKSNHDIVYQGFVIDITAGTNLLCAYSLMK